MLRQLSNASYNNVSGIASQIFNYLDAEVKDNLIFSKYEAERTKWQNWPYDGDNSRFAIGRWSLPGTLDECKSLAYDVYHSIAEGGVDAFEQFTFQLFRGNSSSENAHELNSTFLEYFSEALEDIVNANPEIVAENPKHVPGTTVFIVHGHDNELKTEVQLLLSRAGVHAIVLHEQADKGRTIIDKLVGESDVAGYAIALLTPDDLTDKGTTRARQNVVLEIGYFLGRIGKERLRMIVKDDVEIPSDLQGILYERHDASGAWKMKLLKEMRAVGIFVDLASVVDLL